MAINDVALNGALRSNLLSLQTTERLLDRTQLRLSTGRKVNNALDDANAYFAARSLTDRATDLSRILDGMGQSIQTLKAADRGIELILSLVEQMQALANTARDEGAGTATATTLQTEYDNLRAQIDLAINDAGYRGVNLLNGDSMTVVFNHDASSTLTVTGVTFNSAGLSLNAANFATNADIATNLGEIEAALASLRTQARAFGVNLNVIQSREQFAKEIINTLVEGSDKLTLANQNEEGTNMLALQTRQQLGINSLSLAAQAQQAVLNLF